MGLNGVLRDRFQCACFLFSGLAADHLAHDQKAARHSEPVYLRLCDGIPSDAGIQRSVPRAAAQAGAADETGDADRQGALQHPVPADWSCGRGRAAVDGAAAADRKRVLPAGIHGYLSGRDINLGRVAAERQSGDRTEFSTVV